MSLESILNHILDEADVQKNGIIQEAMQKRDAFIKEANLEGEQIYRETLEKEKILCEKQKRRLVVSANMEAKKNLLNSKQELIDRVFEKAKSSIKKDDLKKLLVSSDKTQEVTEDIDFYIDKARLDFETDIAKILFG